MKDHVSYIHIKDGIWDEAGQKQIFTHAGEGQGDVRRILKDLLSRGYEGGISIEPHLAVVFHDDKITTSETIMYNNYVEYGRRVERMIADVKAELK